MRRPRASPRARRGARRRRTRQATSRARAAERRARLLAPPRSPPRAGRSRSTARSRCARSRAGRYSCAVAASDAFRAGDLRADRRRQDGAGARARRAAARPRRAAGRRLGRRAAGLPRPRDAHRRRRRAAEQARLEHRLVSILPVDARFSVGEYAALAHAEIDGAARRGRAGRSWSAAPACTCAPRSRELDAAPAAARRGPRALGGRARAPRPARRCTPSSRAARRGPARAIEPARPQPDRPRARAARARRARAPGAARTELWTADTRHPTRLVGLVMDREALYARIDARVDAMVAAGAVEEVRARPRRRGLGDRAQGARASTSCWPATSRR